MCSISVIALFVITVKEHVITYRCTAFIRKIIVIANAKLKHYHGNNNNLVL